MNYCENIKDLLLEGGIAAVGQARQGDEALDTHLRSCTKCRSLLAAWGQIPDLLEQLPEHEPDEELVQKVRTAAACIHPATATTRRRFLAPSLASAAVLLAAIGLSRELLMHESPYFHATPTMQQLDGEIAQGPASRPVPALEEGLDEFFDYRGDDASLIAEQEGGAEADRLELSGSRARDNAVVTGFETQDPGEEKRRVHSRPKADLNDLDAEYNFAANEPAIRESEEQAPGRKIKLSKKEIPDLETPLSFASERPLDAVEHSRLPPQAEAGKRDSLVAVVGGAFANAGINFLDHYQQTNNLQVQPATGYWANSYIPGDPEIRLLSARLAQWDRSWLSGNTALERNVTPVQQPFDAPANNALALSLMADASAVSGGDDGATRMRLQVGIRGIEHRRGQRPAMNLAVVVDLPPDAPVDVRIAARALLDALSDSEQAGDRFSVVSTDSELELNAALLHASAMVQQNDDPSRPLGSSSMLLISAGSLADIEQLATLAHQKAKEGVTLSVVPLGNLPQNESVEKLVLAGLGSRRFLEAPDKARRLIEEELHASSRAVARAARLSIRLAPGVQLLEVVGSERLDTRRARRVREIENSMDRRLSANLGIQADRGEDEDGIQIVIPSIFSGDSVTVLLDVVTDRPGAIADVSLRYKDLVFLRNSNLQSHLELGRGENKRGPAELAVLKNLLSHHFVEAVERAADALARQQPEEAIAALSAMRATMEQARRDIPAWANDPEIIRDSQVLDRFIAALSSPASGAHQSLLTDSLLYAAWAKTHRPLAEHTTRSGSNERSY